MLWRRSYWSRTPTFNTTENSSRGRLVLTKVTELLAGVDLLPHSHVRVDWEAPVATLSLGNARQQRVRIIRSNDYYQLSSIVLGRQQTRSLSPKRIAELVWLRNQETDVVAFGWDKRDRLVGRIDQLAETMDAEDLFFYLEMLALECDRLEWLITGEDKQ